jgi:ATP-dependent DNA helicase Rep
MHIVSARPSVLGLRPDFCLYDVEDSRQLVGRLLQESLPEAVGLAAAVQQQIARWKRSFSEPPATTELTASSVTSVAAWLYRRYEQALGSVNAMDADDLVSNAVRLLSIEPALLSDWRGRLRYLLVDEYELASGWEHELVRLLATGGPILNAAADDTPAIQHGPGEPWDSLKRLRSDLPGLYVLRLEQNFRSSGRILKAANTIVAPTRTALEKTLWSAAEYGSPLRVVFARSEEHEAERVVSLLLDQKFRLGSDYRQYGLLFGRPEQAPPIERALQRYRIPYYTSGTASLFDKPEVRDLLTYFKLLNNPADDNAFLRAVNTPRRNIDRATLEQLARFAARAGRSLFECAIDPKLAEALPAARYATLRDLTLVMQNFIERAERDDPVRAVCDLLADLCYEEWLRDTCNDTKIAERRMANVTQLLASLQRLAKQQPEVRLRTLVTQLNRKAVLDPDGDDLSADAVALLSIAEAKGMEFDHVYLVGLEEGLLPATEPGDDENVLRVERHLAYVAITRARESLTFTVAERRRFGGEVVARKPSRFLAELPPDDLERLSGEPAHGAPESAFARSDAYLSNISRQLRKG